VFLKQQFLQKIAHLLSACQDEVAWFPCFYEPFPSKASQQSPSHFLALDYVWLEEDALLQGF